jgi:hypothetical protein
MAEQRSPHHFEFVGIDVICDAHGECYMLEVNRLPGLETSMNRCKPDEDILYNDMMLGVLELAMKSVAAGGVSNVCASARESEGEVAPKLPSRAPQDLPDLVSGEGIGSVPDKSSLWKVVCGPSSQCEYTYTNAIFRNLFAWRAFTKKNRRVTMI